MDIRWNHVSYYFSSVDVILFTILVYRITICLFLNLMNFPNCLLFVLVSSNILCISLGFGGNFTVTKANLIWSND